MSDIEFPNYRRKHIHFSWFLSYFYNIFICVFFFHPEIFNMNLDNINEPALIVAKSACIADIVLTFFIYLLGHFSFSFESSMNEFGKQYLETFADIFKLKINFNKTPNNPQAQLEADFNEYKHEYTYYKNIYLPHSSIQWYSCLTGIYTTLIYVMNFSFEGYIFWGIYLFLLLNSLFSVNYSTYKDLFIVKDFVENIIQFIDLATDCAFIYEVIGLRDVDIQKNNDWEFLIPFFSCAFICWLSFFINSIYSYKIVIEKSKKEEKQDKKIIKSYENKQNFCDFTYGIFNVPVIFFTIFINNDKECEPIKILTIVTNGFVIILTLSKYFSNTCQVSYEDLTVEIKKRRELGC